MSQGPNKLAVLKIKFESVMFIIEIIYVVPLFCNHNKIVKIIGKFNFKINGSFFFCSLEFNACVLKTIS